MRARAICVCRDAGVCQLVTTALTALDVAVEHHAEIPPSADDVALFLVDRASRELVGDALRSAPAPVIIVNDSLDDDDLIALMLERPVSHLVRDADDRELGITSEKLVSGDLFGLEKYLAPASATGERHVATTAEKRAAVTEVTTWAESIGARRPILHRLGLVIDELLMNALYDAPRESGAPRTADQHATLRWGHDDRVIAISVEDAFGALQQRHVIDHVRRARDDKGRPNQASADDPEEGAGLGLYLVLASVASLIVNVSAGRRTEVVCLFDLARPSERAVTGGVRSLHVFQQR